MSKSNKKKENLSQTERIEKAICYEFKDKDLLWKSLKHSSYAQIGSNPHDYNERLGFLGEAVLGLVAGGLQYRFPNPWCGFTSAKTQVELGEKLGLGEFIKLKLTEKQGDSISPKIMSDTFKAIAGAIYLDSQYNFNLVQDWFNVLLPKINPAISKASKPQVAYQKFDYLGKKVLHLIATDYLYYRFPTVREVLLITVREGCKEEMLKESQFGIDFLGEMFLEGEFSFLRLNLQEALNKKQADNNTTEKTEQ